MNTFRFQDEVQKIIDAKKLVEVDLLLGGKFDHFIAFLIHVNDDYLTFARVSNDVTLQGVTICRMESLESIQTETGFVRELRKSLPDDTLFKESLKEVQLVKDFTFQGFTSAFVDTDRVLDVTSENEGFTGKVIAYDESILLLDEYYAEDEERFARTYINPAIITTITVGGTWLKLIERSLAAKAL